MENKYQKLLIDLYKSIDLPDDLINIMVHRKDLTDN